MFREMRRKGQSLSAEECEMILKNEKSREETEASELLHLIEQFRKTIEILLSLRYGSLTLLNLSDIMAIIGQIHQHWNYA